MQRLRIGSTITASVGTPQTSDISVYTGVVTNVTDAYVEIGSEDETKGTVIPWHRILNLGVTAA